MSFSPPADGIATQSQSSTHTIIPGPPSVHGAAEPASTTRFGPDNEHKAEAATARPPNTSSTPPLDDYEALNPTIPARHISIPHDLVSRFSKQRRKLSEQRDLILQTRSQLDYEQQRVGINQSFVSKSDDQWMEALNHVMAHRNFESSYGILSELQSKCAQDRLALSRQQEETKRLSSTLSNYEYHLMNGERAFATVVQSIALVFAISSDDLTLSSEPSTDEDSASNTPSLLARYFDRKGDVGIYRERLEELEYSHCEAQVNRNFLSDQGKYLETTDEQFEASFQAKWQEILDDLKASEDDVDRLAILCNEGGFDVKFPRAPSENDLDQQLASHGDYAQINDFDQSEFVTRHLHTQDPCSQTDPADIVTIGHWLENISGDTPKDISQSLPGFLRAPIPFVLAGPRKHELAPMTTQPSSFPGPGSVSDEPYPRSRSV